MALHDYEMNARVAELQDIAALDHFAQEGQPAAVLNRWARREHPAPRRGALWRWLHLER